MRKILAYLLSPVFYLAFGLILLVFHPIQWMCLNLFGYQAHKKSVDFLNFFLIRSTHLLGTRYSFDHQFKIPTSQPVIIVANHQSLYDIPPIIWFMRKHHPKFISKKELGKGIPSVSFNLRHGGSALIDRKDPKQSIPALKAFALYIEKNKRAAVIFPEGTRSRTGKPKKFAVNGLKVLFKHIPDALVVPVTINNSWKMLRYGKYPMGVGSHLKFKVHEPIRVGSVNDDELISLVEKIITQDIIV
ncbi:1-acyl-sn-glycerol-3-phosphate acyltransferase [Flavobacteriaceae bacterium R38]|nr:1-acyl-sn-glycerol-3-phosphate acyltransferase [Flavobacteriaceae bacterium R38]